MQKVLIIAEAGVNHNGDVDQAKRLVDAAADAGADFVKFQTFKTEASISKSAKKAAYQARNTGEEESQYEMLKRLELSEEMHEEIIAHCEKRNIRFLSTGFDLDSLEYLDQLGIPLFKIPSGEITNLPYLRKVCSFNKPIVMSSGKSYMEDVEAAFNVLITNGVKKEDITILHCTSEYPTPYEDVNLKAMNTIREELDVNVGYSDHTLGIEVPIAAVALGARVIEKHFTLDRSLPGPDHKASLEPDELKAMVSSIRNIELAISGSGKKEPAGSERKSIHSGRKSIVAKRPIKKGESFSEENLVLKRPGTGISPMKWDDVLQQKASRDFAEDEQISL